MVDYLNLLMRWLADLFLRGPFFDVDIDIEPGLLEAWKRIRHL